MILDSIIVEKTGDGDYKIKWKTTAPKYRVAVYSGPSTDDMDISLLLIATRRTEVLVPGIDPNGLRLLKMHNSEPTVW
jgi:hypothetical protein